MLFVPRRSVLPGLAPHVTLPPGQVYHWKIPLNFVPFSLIGLTLAIFLGFRNSTSYARYWEARTLWGAVLNETRALLRQALTLTDPPSEAAGLSALLIAFVHALRHQLRGTDPTPDFDRLLSP